MNEVLTIIVYPFAAFLFALLVLALGYFLKRFIDGQDQMNRTLTTISERLGSMEMWAKLQERLQNERHEENKRNIAALWDAVGGGHG